MSKIMELADAMGQQMKAWPSGNISLGEIAFTREALQAEVTRMEAELAAAIANASKFAALHTASATLCETVAQERDKLWAKLAELEAQEPVARVTVCDMNAIYWLAPTHSATFNTPLYLAAGAKEKP